MATQLGLLAKTVLLILLCTTISSSPEQSLEHNCDKNYGNSGELHVNCAHRNLRSVPTSTSYPSEAVTLDLSGNSLKTLEEGAFIQYPSLNKLNLSAAGIQSVHISALDGLSQLQILDLTNNPFLDQNNWILNHTLFKPCPLISHLYISGSPLPGEVFKALTNLQEITMTPHEDMMPFELIRLPKLRVLNFAFCHFRGLLNRDMMQPIIASNITELALHACNIVKIEPGAFDGAGNLQLLNLAGNTHANFVGVIEVLSNSTNLRPETLILDLLGTSLRQPVVLGTYHNGKCHKLWDHVKHLSVRGIRLVNIQHLECFNNLVSVSIGFNSPLFMKPQHARGFVNHSKIVYVDSSYFFVEDYDVLGIMIGLPKAINWILPNHSYFPKRQTEWEKDCPEWSDPGPLQNGCKELNILPRCLAYLKIDHLSFLGRTDDEVTRACVRLSLNNLRYLNVSRKLHDAVLDSSYIRIMGWMRLEVLDLSGIGMSKMVPSNFHFCGTLEELYLSSNSMHGIAKFPECKELQIVDLSDNKISSIPNDTWANVPNLKKIDLRNNYLQQLNWYLPNMGSLRWLGLENNKIQYVGIKVRRTINNLSNKSDFIMALSGNPLQCICEQISFIVWLRDNTASLDNFDSLVCSAGSQTSAIKDLDVKNMEWKCSNNDHKIMVSCIVLGVSVILISVSLLLYKYRWTLKWKYYRARFGTSRRTEILLDDLFNEPSFSAFVIYPYEDEQIRSWVISELRHKIEVEWQKSECYIRGRNDMPGFFVTNNIVNGLMQSQCAVWLICPGFFEDTLCEMAAHFALNHFGITRNMLLIMENRFDQYRVPKHLATLLGPKMSMTRLRFTENEDGHSLFWSKLRDFIPG